LICSFNFLIFLAVCLNISTVINIKILTNSDQQTQSYKFTSHIAAFLSVVLITEMLEICIQTSYDQNVQLILKSYLPVEILIFITVDIFKHTAKKIRKLNEQIKFYLNGTTLIHNFFSFVFANKMFQKGYWFLLSNEIFNDWSQFLFGSWRNNLNQVVHTV
jgi:hypothetical protein